MMLRREITGLHQYDKESGVHVLFNEVKIPEEEAAKRGPRHLSLMLTRRCNLNCPFCYVEKSASEAPLEFLIDVCDAAKELQVLNITLGGGEPTLYKSFSKFISHAWENYDFGISVTTNATTIGPLLEVAGMLSSLRVSTDNIVRPLNLELKRMIAKLTGVHKVGANMLWSTKSLAWAQKTITSLSSIGVQNFLIIPEHSIGQYSLNEDDWSDLKRFIQEQSEIHQIMLTEDAVNEVNIPVLKTESDDEFLFAHIDETGEIRERSWGASTRRAREVQEIIHGLQQLNPLRRKWHENMD